MFPSWMKLTILSIDSSAAPSPSLEGLAALSSVAVAVPSLPTDDSVTVAKAVNFHPSYSVGKKAKKCLEMFIHGFHSSKQIRLYYVFYLVTKTADRLQHKLLLKIIA